MVKIFKEKLMAAQLCGTNKNVMIYLQGENLGVM